MADTGVPPLFWTKLRPEGPKKKFLGAAPPPYFRVWMTAPPPPPPPPPATALFQGLDPALEFLSFSQPKLRLLADF